MNGRSAAKLASGIWLIAALLLATSLTFALINRNVDRGESDSALIGLFFSFEILATVSVGALLANRRTGNPIGWLLLGYGFVGALAGAADGYAVHALLTEPGLLPAGKIAAALAAAVIDSAALTLGFFVFLFILFPYGRLESRFWRRAMVVLVPLLAILQALAMLNPGELAAFPIENPLGVAALEDFGVLDAPLLLALLGFICASAFSLVKRFLRSRDEERQQLKWVVSAVVFLALSLASGPLWWTGIIPENIAEIGWPILFATALSSIPLACAFAILRYRLYEIDIIVNRAVVFGTLTAFLAGLYAASIQLFKTLFSGVTGETSDAAIVMTTLVLAAIFTPAKNRLQKLVDKYFGHMPQAQDIHAYIDQLRFVIQVLDAAEGASRLLEQSVAKVNATGGAVFLNGPEERSVRAGSYDLSAAPTVRIPIQHGGHDFGRLLLGPQRDGTVYTPEDLEPLRTAATMFGHALALASELAPGIDVVPDDMSRTTQQAAGESQPAPPG